MQSGQLTLDDVFQPTESELTALVNDARLIYELAAPTMALLSPIPGEPTAGATALGVTTLPVTLGSTGIAEIGIGVRFYQSAAAYSFYANAPDPTTTVQPLPLGAAKFYGSSLYESVAERDLWKRYLSTRMATRIMGGLDESRRPKFLFLDHALTFTDSQSKQFGVMPVGGPLDYYRAAMKQLVHLCSNTTSVVGVQYLYRSTDVVCMLDEILADQVRTPETELAEFPSQVFGNDFVFLNGVDPDETLFSVPGSLAETFTGGIIHPSGFPNVVMGPEGGLFAGSGFLSILPSDSEQGFGAFYYRARSGRYIRLELILPQGADVTDTVCEIVRNQLDESVSRPHAVAAALGEMGGLG